MKIEMTPAEIQEVAQAMLDDMFRQGEANPAALKWVDDTDLSSVTLNAKTDMLKVARSAVEEISRILAQRMELPRSGI